MRRANYTFDVYIMRDGAWHYHRRYTTPGHLRRLLVHGKAAGQSARIHVFDYSKLGPGNKGRLVVVQTQAEWLRNFELNAYETALDDDALRELQAGGP